MGQKYAAYDAQGAITGFYDSIDSPVPSGVETIEITDEQWQTCLSQPGWTVTDDALTAPAVPTAAELLAQARATQTALMYQAYGEAVTQSVSFKSAGGVTQTFQADTNSQNILLQSYTGFSASGSVPTGFYWVATDNTQVPFTLADLKGLYAAMLAQGWTAFQHLQDQKAAIRTAATATDVRDVVW